MDENPSSESLLRVKLLDVLETFIGSLCTTPFHTPEEEEGEGKDLIWATSPLRVLTTKGMEPGQN